MPTVDDLHAPTEVILHTAGVSEVLLNTSDSNVALRTFQPVIRTAKLLGLLPLEVEANATTKFQKRLIFFVVIFHRLLVLGFMWFLALSWTLSATVDWLKLLKMDDPMYKVVTLINLVANFLYGSFVYVYCIARSRTMITFMENWRSLDVLIKGRLSQKSLRGFFWVIVALIGFTCVLIVSSVDRFDKNQVFFSALNNNDQSEQNTKSLALVLVELVVCTFFSFPVQYFPEVFFLYSCRVLSLSFDIVRRQTAAVIALEDETLGESLPTLRQRHTQVCRLTDDLQHLFSPLIATSILLNATCICVFVYYLVFWPTMDTLDISLITISGFVLMNLVRLLAITVAADDVAKQAQSPLYEFYNADEVHLDSDGQVQLTLFLHKLNNRPAEITANGFFTINRKFLTTVLSVIATYILVLVEVKLELGGSISPRTTPTTPTPLINDSMPPLQPPL